jgi:hypothetical protein
MRCAAQQGKSPGTEETDAEIGKILTVLPERDKNEALKHPFSKN